MTNKKNKILVCIGNKDVSGAALKYAALKAKKSNFVIELLTVIDTTGKGFGLFSSVDKVMHAEKRQKVEKYMKQAAEEVEKISKTIPVINIKEGFISDEIENTLKEDQSVNMIIIGSSEESSNRGKLISTLSEHIAYKVELPLMIIPNNLKETEIKQIL